MQIQTVISVERPLSRQDSVSAIASFSPTLGLAKGKLFHVESLLQYPNNESHPNVGLARWMHMPRIVKSQRQLVLVL